MHAADLVEWQAAERQHDPIERQWEHPTVKVQRSSQSRYCMLSPTKHARSCRSRVRP